MGEFNYNVQEAATHEHKTASRKTNQTFYNIKFKEHWRE